MIEFVQIYNHALAGGVHQAKIIACVIVKHDDGRQEVRKCEFGAFKDDRRTPTHWALQIQLEAVVMDEYIQRRRGGWRAG